jgi:chaperonin GroEL (HSP60 family)
VTPAPKTRFVDRALPGDAILANAELELTARRMYEVLEALGVGLVICQWGVDPALVQLLAQHGVQVVKWVGAQYVEQSAMITGATICWRFSDLAARMLGVAVESNTMYLGGDAARSPMLVLEGSGVPFVTLLACASSQAACQEVGRTMGDAVGVIRCLSITGQLVVGAGAFEMELHVRLASLKRNSDNADEFAFRAWAKALVHLPVCIAQAASLDAGQLVGTLKDAHLRGDAHAGLDVERGEVVDSLHRGVVEPLISKQRWMSMATDLAVLLLSIGSIRRMQAP